MGSRRTGTGKSKARGARSASRAQERSHLLEVAARADMPPCADVCVIGGGAAGLACAIAAKEAGASRVVVLERDVACGRTILATGNGRCNFCNTRLAPENYNHPELATHVMGKPDDALARVLDFFRAGGLAWAEEDGRLYPRSRQAASVRNVLLSRCWRDGVTLAPARTVLGATRRHGSWYVRYREGWVSTGSGFAAAGSEGAGGLGGIVRTLRCRSLVLASGGGSSFLAEKLGLPLVPESPVLCGVAAEASAPGLLDALDGRRAHATATLTRSGRVIIREAGEVLFRPWGLSGIVSFDLSRHARPDDLIELDLAPEVDAWEVDGIVASRPGDTAALDGILDPVIAAELVRLAGGVHMSGLAWRVAPLVKGLPLRVTGLADTAHAQVTRGGVNVSALDPATLSVRGRPGLFACGEALDVDGACGGFNLAWAWTSGMRVGEVAAARP